jgi:uncharacterized protein (DUF427 family)
MSGHGPLSKRPTGRFNFDPEPPGAALLWDPVPYRVRAIVEKQVLVDSRRASLLHESGRLPVYYFPLDDLRDDLLAPAEKRTHCPWKGDATYRTIRVGDRVVPDAVWAYEDPIEPAAFLRGHAALEWNAVDEWFAEDAQLFGHPRDPYQRIDVWETSQHVRVVVGGEVVADTRRAKMLVETGLPPRYYLPLADVRFELLEPSPTKTRCAYKGSASYWHVRAGSAFEDDLAWTYRDPQHDAEQVRDRVAFFNERVDLELDGAVQERPRTQWSR